MKRLILFIKKTICSSCYGMGVTEISGGDDTVECTVCHGKGVR